MAGDLNGANITKMERISKLLDKMQRLLEIIPVEHFAVVPRSALEFLAVPARHPGWQNDACKAGK